LALARRHGFKWSKHMANWKDWIPRRIARMPRQLARISPFGGDIQPARVPLLRSVFGGPTLPFPHPWNYHRPLSILESFFCGAEEAEGWARHNRYLEVPGFAPVLVTRDPAVIRAIATETGDARGQFDRDTLPSKGIARATGVDTLLYANGALWKRQKRLTGPPFARGTIFQPEQFEQFADTFRLTVRQRLDVLQQKRLGPDSATARVQIEPEIKAVMLEMLVNNFFGAEISYDQIRDRYVPALERVIDHIVRDTVRNKLGIPIRAMPAFTRRIAEIKQAYADFDRLTDLVIAPRREGKRLWKQFKSDAPDEALRGNIRVFLAGALEATTSYAAWAIFHLGNHPAAQERVFHEVKDIDQYTPTHLEEARYLCCVLNETLRLTPALYFLPRKATENCWVTTAKGNRLMIPKGTHILLDVWHANRHEDHWGISATGHPAADFVPERWESMSMHDHGSREFAHFGFGHGPRFCPGKNLGQLEVALVVGAFVKLFQFKAINRDCNANVGVSTKPADGVLVELRMREHVPPQSAGTLAPNIAIAEDTPINARIPNSGTR
jgi:cytochrome P450